MIAIKKVVVGGVEWRNEAGELHREDGPAIEYADGTKFWFVNGQRHRLDGPAVEWYDGSVAYWIEGKHLTFKQFLARTTRLGKLLYD